MFPEERRNMIMQIILKNKCANVMDLSKQFSVSEETIRRDLRYFQKQNVVKKTYGMVTLSEEIADLYVPSIKKRELKEKEEKIAIAEAAVKLIEDGQFVLLDAGSTTKKIAEKIEKFHNYKNLSVPSGYRRN